MKHSIRERLSIIIIFCTIISVLLSALIVNMAVTNTFNKYMEDIKNIMVIKTTKFKEICSTILGATDSAEISTLTETLELKAENKVLYLNVTNGEYYASVKFDLDSDETFNAAVNASLFLKLIAAVTSENIELEVKDTYVLAVSAGSATLPKRCS